MPELVGWTKDIKITCPVHHEEELIKLPAYYEGPAYCSRNAALWVECQEWLVTVVRTRR